MSAGDLSERLQGVGVNDASFDDEEGGAVVVGGKKREDDGGVGGTPFGGPAAASAKSRAIELIDDDRLLQAARVIRESGIAVEGGQGEEKLLRFMSKASLMEELLQSLKSTPDEKSGWLVQGEHMGKRDVSIYYRTDKETGTKLTARIESPIDKTMLVPFLSVLNESELYSTWLPDWTVPRLRVRRSDKLIQHGRCSQVVLVTVDLPWPFSSREVVLDACGVDDIEYTGDIAVLVRALHPGDTSTGTTVPDVDSSDIVRIDFHGGFLFRRLPDEWRGGGNGGKGSGAATGTEFGSEFGSAGNGNVVATAVAAPAAAAAAVGDDEYEDEYEDEDGDTFFDADEEGVCASVEDDDGKILVSMQMYMDPKLSYVPTSLLNFVIRTVLYMMWCMLLRVAEGIRDDKMPDHKKAIAAKTSLYRWVERRARVMLDRLFAPTPHEALAGR